MLDSRAKASNGIEMIKKLGLDDVEFANVWVRPLRVLDRLLTRRHIIG